MSGCLGVHLRTRVAKFFIAVTSDEPVFTSYVQHNTVNQLTPWSIVLLEKLIVPQLVKNFTPFHGIPWVIAMFTIALHLSLS
jgi:hypothetical protein